jgi:Protein of unknown function (DUF3618)
MTEGQTPARGHAETRAADVQAEIELTRQQLGETVEALAAKADVKAKARRKVTEAKQKAFTRGRQVKDQAAVGLDHARQKAAARAGGPGEAVPERLRNIARHAADSARNNPESLTAAVTAVVLACIAIAAWTRRQ